MGTYDAYKVVYTCEDATSIEPWERARSGTGLELSVEDGVGEIENVERVLYSCTLVSRLTRGRSTPSCREFVSLRRPWRLASHQSRRLADHPYKSRSIFNKGVLIRYNSM